MALFPQQNRLRRLAHLRLPRGRLPRHHRAPVAHLRSHVAAHLGRLDDGGAHEAGQEGLRAWGRHIVVGDDAQQRLRQGFRGPAGEPHAIGDVFHITSDELLTWNQIYELVAKAAGVEAQIVHVPSDLIAAFDANMCGSAGRQGAQRHLRQQQSQAPRPRLRLHHPFAHGIQDVIAWYDANPERQVINPDVDALTDRIVAAMESIWPKSEMMDDEMMA
ncbi:MAG: hypothetical protein R2856_39795 [Caldilineaceae bacterium]